MMLVDEVWMGNWYVYICIVCDFEGLDFFVYWYVIDGVYIGVSGRESRIKVSVVGSN